MTQAAGTDLSALRRIEPLADLDDADLEWFHNNCTYVQLQPGEAYVTEGAPADSMFIVLDGEIRARRESGGDQPIYTASAGTVTGALPFSRMTHYARTGRATVPTRLAIFPKERFPELFARVPVLLERLVHVMADRIRDVTISDQQHEKLIALGRLSGGLAHELNNPASAARRAHDEMRESLHMLLNANVRLDERPLTLEQRSYLACAEREIVEALGNSPVLDPVHRSDRESAIADWLDRHGIPSPWTLAPAIVDMECSESDLDDVASRFDPEDLPCVISRLTATSSVGLLLNQMNQAMARISSLIETMKSYSNMDRMSEQEFDLHVGLESTLSMLQSRLSNGIRVTRTYDSSIPHVLGNPGALNQVWTNLIENGLDAMGSNGVLTVRTARQHDHAMVEVADTGAGIPESIRSRVFEPFFSTKPPGQGIGLGLDTVFRIVRQHHGLVTFTSAPGDTRFCVQLPFRRAYSL